MAAGIWYREVMRLIIVRHGGIITPTLTYIHDEELVAGRHFHPDNTAVPIFNIDSAHRAKPPCSGMGESERT